MTRKLVLLAIAVLLSACGPPLVWVRPNTSTEQIQQDLAQCDNAALRETRFGYWPSWYGPSPYWPNHDYLFWRQQYEMDRQLDEQRLRDFCMRSRGYHLEAIQPATSAP